MSFPILYCPNCGEDRLEHGDALCEYLCRNCFVAVRVEVLNFELLTKVQCELWEQQQRERVTIKDADDLLAKEGGGA